MCKDIVARITCFVIQAFLKVFKILGGLQMFNRLFMVTTALLFASVLNAETYYCEVNISSGLIKNITTDNVFVPRQVTFDTYENDIIKLDIKQDNHRYAFDFEVTTSHNINIIDSGDLSCSIDNTLTNRLVSLSTHCTSKIENKEIFSAYCQPLFGK